MAHRGWHQEGMRPETSKKLGALHSTASQGSAVWAPCGNLGELSQAFFTELNARTNANIKLGGDTVDKPEQVIAGFERATAACDFLGDVDDDVTLNEDEIRAWKYAERRRLMKGHDWIGDDSSIDFDDFTLGSMTTKDASTIATMTTRGSESKISLQRLRKAHTQH